MKKIKQLGKIAFLALAISFGSCSSDDGGGSVSAGAGTISAKVDGKTVTTIQAGTTASVNGSFVMLSGTTMSQEAFTIVIYDYNGAGTYSVITGNDLGAVFTYSKININDPLNTSNTWYAPLDETTGTSGTITITEESETDIKGTFSFKAINDLGTFKNVTNGSFNIPLGQQ